MENLSTILKQRRKDLGLTLAQIADQMGVAEATVQRWESGNIKSIRYDKIGKLADVLQVNPASFMGWGNSEGPLPANVIVVEPMDKIPLLGRIACGEPILAEENIEDYVDLPRHIKADFALTCRGDSMINAGIQDGDVVYIRQQEHVENGQIAAVRIGDDEATLKRFYYDGECVRLVAENPSFATKIFFGQEMNQIHVIGLAVAYTHAIEK